MTRPFLLTAYPLSHEFRERLADELGGEAEALSLPELRRLRPGALWRVLRPLRGRACLIPLEDPSSRAVLPLLQAVALAALPSSIEVVHPDLRRERVPRSRVVPTLARVAAAGADGLHALRTAGAELDDLLVADPSAPVLGAGRRVLSLNGNLWFGVKAGGSLAHTAGVANALAKAGHEVELVAPFAVPELHPRVRAHVVAPPRAFAVPGELNYFRHQRALLGESGRIAGAGSPLRFVYQRLSILNYAGVPLSRRLAVPLVVEYNGSEVWVARHWGRPLRYESHAQRAEDALLRHAHLVVTVSDVLRDELLERGIPAQRVVTYPNGVDPLLYDAGRFHEDARARVRARYGIPADALVATFVGTFGRWHGTDVLARTIRRLVDGEPSWLAERRLHFLLVGDGLRMPEALAELGERRGPHHTLAGLLPQDEAAAHLAASDLLLSPHVRNDDGSRFFGSPTKLFEYMAMGKPVVASDLEQIGAVLRPALRAASLPDSAPPAGSPELAVLAEPGSEQELRAGIRFLVERPDWRTVLGANARAAVLERYTWDAHVAAILELLEELCG
jgi:glycosyltransferase involved in cell wall biosynthesis